MTNQEDFTTPTHYGETEGALPTPNKYAQAKEFWSFRTRGEKWWIVIGALIIIGMCGNVLGITADKDDASAKETETVSSPAEERTPREAKTTEAIEELDTLSDEDFAFLMVLAMDDEAEWLVKYENDDLVDLAQAACKDMRLGVTLGALVNSATTHLDSVSDESAHMFMYSANAAYCPHVEIKR